VLDGALEGRDYLLGSDYTLADTHMWSFVDYMTMFKFELSKTPNVEAWFKRVSSRPQLKGHGLNWNLMYSSICSIPNIGEAGELSVEPPGLFSFRLKQGISSSKLFVDDSFLLSILQSQQGQGLQLWRASVQNIVNKSLATSGLQGWSFPPLELRHSHCPTHQL
jgi:Glutathione S-transferase, C-terminal domain